MTSRWGEPDPGDVPTVLGGWLRRYHRHTASILARRRRDVDIYRESIAAVVGEGVRVLHLGCGWDRSGVTRGLAQYCHVVGVDSDALAIERFHGEAWEASAEDLPFAEASFDVVVCEYVFEHLERPQHVMAEVARVLRIGGVFMALAPNRWSYKSLLAAATSMSVHTWAAARLRPDSRHSKDVHPTRYRLNTFIEVQQSAALHGFRIERFTFLNNGPTWFQHIPVLFEVGVLVHWVMDHFVVLERLKCGFLVVMRRHNPGVSGPDQRAEQVLRIRCLSCGRCEMIEQDDGFHCRQCGRIYPRKGRRIIARS